MLRVSIAAFSKNAFKIFVKKTASNFTGGDNANSCFRRACSMLVHFAQDDRELSDILVSFSRSGKILVQNLKNVLNVLKYVCLLEGLKNVFRSVTIAHKSVPTAQLRFCL